MCRIFRLRSSGQACVCKSVYSGALCEVISSGVAKLAGPMGKLVFPEPKPFFFIFFFVFFYHPHSPIIPPDCLGPLQYSPPLFELLFLQQVRLSPHSPHHVCLIPQFVSSSHSHLCCMRAQRKEDVITYSDLTFHQYVASKVCIFF